MIGELDRCKVVVLWLVGVRVCGGCVGCDVGEVTGVIVLYADFHGLVVYEIR